ncbi:hypothetical protein BDB00DRAFT_114796 [Zychaea mexicana]|uniref:uncharacterized protein n=1 Tax=Zychaea mexicana TaxID=64656 RepID=UPI0022FE8BEF|nr:uncharacterized protein BDB00DRAFT_114796 [Zychaea mexicana]KAI9484715.1 hypothetical protein BDB00DRAFT_114796 [Zychaea mexicana]
MNDELWRKYNDRSEVELIDLVNDECLPLWLAVSILQKRQIKRKANFEQLVRTEHIWKAAHDNFARQATAKKHEDNILKEFNMNKTMYEAWIQARQKRKQRIAVSQKEVDKAREIYRAAINELNKAIEPSVEQFGPLYEFEVARRAARKSIQVPDEEGNQERLPSCQLCTTNSWTFATKDPVSQALQSNLGQEECHNKRKVAWEVCAALVQERHAVCRKKMTNFSLAGKLEPSLSDLPLNLTEHGSNTMVMGHRHAFSTTYFSKTMPMNQDSTTCAGKHLPDLTGGTKLTNIHLDQLEILN